MTCGPSSTRCFAMPDHLLDSARRMWAAQAGPSVKVSGEQVSHCFRNRTIVLFRVNYWTYRGGQPYQCRVCGVETPFHFVVDASAKHDEYIGRDPRPWCEAHCPDHDYFYEPGLGHICRYCDKIPEPDYFSDYGD